MGEYEDRIRARLNYHEQREKAEGSGKNWTPTYWSAFIDSGNYPIVIVIDREGQYSNGKYTFPTVIRGVHKNLGTVGKEVTVRCNIINAAQQMEDGSTQILDGAGTPMFAPNYEEKEDHIGAIERGITAGLRCPICELNLAALTTKNEAVLRNFTGRYSISQAIRCIFAHIPYNKYFAENPDFPQCLGNKPDKNARKCKTCDYRQECYSGKFGIHLCDKTLSIESQILELDMRDDLRNVGGLYSPENSQLLIFTTEKKNNFTQYTITPMIDTVTGAVRVNLVQMFQEVLQMNFYDILQETWPLTDNLFMPSHTYSEIITELFNPVQQDCLANWLAQVGLDVPVSPQSEPAQEPAVQPPAQPIASPMQRVNTFTQPRPSQPSTPPQTVLNTVQNIQPQAPISPPVIHNVPPAQPIASQAPVTTQPVQAPIQRPSVSPFKQQSQTSEQPAQNAPKTSPFAKFTRK